MHRPAAPAAVGSTPPSGAAMESPESPAKRTKRQSLSFQDEADNSLNATALSGESASSRPCLGSPRRAWPSVGGPFLVRLCGCVSQSRHVLLIKTR